MKTVKTILIIYLVSLLSVIILPRILIFYSSFNIILVVSLFYISQKDLKTGILWASLGGLFLDFLGTGFPSNFIVLLIIALLVALISAKLFEFSVSYLFLGLCFVSSLIYNSAIVLINHLGYQAYFSTIIIGAFYSLIPAIIIVLFSRYLFGRNQEKNLYLERL